MTISTSGLLIVAIIVAALLRREALKRHHNDGPPPGSIVVDPVNRIYTDRAAIEADIATKRAMDAAALHHTLAADEILRRAMPEPTPLPTPEECRAWYQQNPPRHPRQLPRGRG